MIYPIDEGRINIMRRYMRHTRGLNVGSGLQRFPNKINIDLVKDKRHDVDIIGDVCDLGMFKDTGVDEVFLFDVLEHIKKGQEKKAIREIYSVLEKGGQLLMSVPNKGFWNYVLDPFWWIGVHRHYNKNEIRSFFEGSGFKIQHLFTAGEFPFGALVTIIYVINRYVLKRKELDWFSKNIIKAYDHEIGTDGGGTLFCIAIKKVKK